MFSDSIGQLRRFSTRRQKVVVTGMGALTSLGVGLEATYQAVLANKVAILPLAKQEYPYGVETVGCPLPDYANDPAFIEKYGLKSKEPCFAHANFAFKEALESSGLYQEGVGLQANSERVGMYFCSYFTTSERVMYLDSLNEDSKMKLAYPAIQYELAEEYELYGLIMSQRNACSASLMAIGDSARLIQNGYYDAIIAGGFDKNTGSYHDYVFSQMGVYSLSCMQSPQTYIKAFDSKREGTCLGDGGSFLVLESEEHALARGAVPLCEIKAYHTHSIGSDFLKPDQMGIQKLLSNVTKQTGWRPQEIDVINAHATGTKAGDPIEVAAIKNYLGSKYEDLLQDRFSAPEHLDFSNLDKTVVNALKGYFGHMILGAGSTELAVTIRAMMDDIALATVNLDSPIDSDLCIPTTGQHLKREINKVCKIALGFGANNSVVGLEKYHQH